MDTRGYVILTLAAVWGLLEFRHLQLRAAKAGEAKVDDRKTLETIFLVAVPSSLLAVALHWFGQFPIPWSGPVFWVGAGFSVFGMALREVSVFALGRYFVVEVAVQAGQTVVERGPYRLVRHPSYAGAMVTMLGFGLMSGDWLGLAIAVIPGCWTLLRRIALEEEVLCRELGDPYREYMKRSKRLVPFVY